MANILPKEKQLQVIHLLVEGNSVRSVVRLTGVNLRTVLRLLVKVGSGCRNLMDERMRDLTLKHIQCDEIWTYVQKKEARISDEHKSYLIGDQFVFIGLDTETKLIPTFAIGKRSADLTRRFMADLASRLIFPKAGAGDAHAFRPDETQIVTQISTDGFAPYPEAVDFAFGGKVKFGTIVKEFRNASRPYVPSEIVGSKRRGIKNISSASGLRSICTSHVERQNLTIRTFVKRFTRLTIAFSKKLENHEAAIAMFVAYYNFVWRTRHSDKSGRPGKLRPTAAMMAKVVPDLWNFDRLYEEVIQYG